MQVKISKDIFNSSAHDSELNKLLNFFSDGRHFLVFEDEDEIEAYRNSSWKKNELNKRQLKDIDEYIVASTRRKKSKKTISVSNKDSIFFTPIEAYLYLGQPLVVILENSEYELPFINAIIRHFDFSGSLEHAKQQLWLIFENGGGSSINSVIKGKISSYTSMYFTKPPNNYLRTFVIMDSDKKYPDMQIVKSKWEFLKQNDIHFHILYKREKENYMPSSIFQNFVNTDKQKRKYAKCFLQLNNPQKDFIDIEKGFFAKKGEDKKSIKKREELLPEEIALYNKIPAYDYEILDIGFSQFGNFKSTFSNHFNEVSREDMLERISHQPKLKSEIDERERNEFDHIVHELIYLL